MASALSSTFLSAALFSPTSSSSSSSPSSVVSAPAPNVRRAGRGNPVCVVSCCQSSSSSSSPPADEKREEKWVASRRDMVAGSISVMSAGFFALPALALLEADDDESLLEKVKEDRKKRIEKRGAVVSFTKETESVQKAVYELSKAGQAIDGEDYGLASTVLGTSDVAWIKEVKTAISKVNKSPEEEGEAANFSAALQALQSAVRKKNPKESKTAFVASANALEKWSSLTGLSDRIKGL